MIELALRAPSPSAWLNAVLGDFDAFLRDHASCEKKASGMAIAIASHYPDRFELLQAMADLAVEELAHYREVIGLMIARGIAPGPDTKDTYVNRLNAAMRRGPKTYLTDRLLLGALIERRGHERFSLIGAAVADPVLARFYSSIARSEDRHWSLFLDHAQRNAERQDALAARIDELLDLEADIMTSLPIRAALH